MDLEKVVKEIREILESKRDEFNLTFTEEDHKYMMVNTDGEVVDTHPSVSKVTKLFYEEFDAEGCFAEESWERPEGGGGRSRVMKGGRVFEQGGVNFSEVDGSELPPSILSQRPEAKGHRWFATGTSMVLHPRNPYIPTVHLNYRYFEAGPVWWFGGGADLTPYYPFLEDAQHFHRTLKGACDSVNPAYYEVFKPWCDEYFFLPHRNEPRGIGGIFYDHFNSGDWAKDFAFTKDVGLAFLDIYPRLVRRNMDRPYTDDDREEQLIRRGRYVEYNLLYDRGTIFGLKTGGNVESILSSMPPIVKWP